MTVKTYLITGFLLGFSVFSQAAVINWGAATDLTSASDIVTDGTLVEALNYGNGGNTTINTVPFSSASIAGYNDFMAALAGGSSGDPNLDLLLNNVSWRPGAAFDTISLASGML